MKGKGKIIHGLNKQATRHEDILGSGAIAPPSLTSALDGSVWPASEPPVAVVEEAALAPDRKDRNLLPLAGIELRLLGHPASSLIAIPTELSWFVKSLIY
jgi:hypothetical protein